jgi:methyltransferase (TIGR00027 family)
MTLGCGVVPSLALAGLCRLGQSGRVTGFEMVAIGSAANRALHLLADGEPKILEDPFALPLSGFTEAQVLDMARSGALPSRSALGVLRTRYVEDRLQAARTRGVRQYVVLGAGLDTFALRNPAPSDGLIVYEVDDPHMQSWTRARLDGLGIAAPDCLRFAPCDFETDSLPTALESAGFARDQPALISWMAVTQFLTHEAVSATLRWAAGLPSGSEIVLTYVIPGAEASRMKERLSAVAIRFETFFTPDEMVSLLERSGFQSVERLTPEEADNLYFTDRSDGLHAPHDEQLVMARTA